MRFQCYMTGLLNAVSPLQLHQSVALVEPSSPGTFSVRRLQSTSIEATPSQLGTDEPRVVKCCWLEHLPIFKRCRLNEPPSFSAVDRVPVVSCLDKGAPPFSAVDWGCWPAVWSCCGPPSLRLSERRPPAPRCPTAGWQEAAPVTDTEHERRESGEDIRRRTQNTGEVWRQGREYSMHESLCMTRADCTTAVK